MKRLKNPLRHAGRTLALAVVMFAVSPAPVFAAPGDAAFLAARDAARKGDAAQLARALTALPATHPLRPWAEYWQLKQQLDADDASGISGIGAFLAANEGSYLAEKLRGDWLRWLGKRGDREAFQREWPRLVEANSELRCYAAQVADTPQMVRSPWLAGEDLPTACELLVDRLVAAGGLTVEDVWQRVRRLLEAKKVGAGRAAAQYLPADQGFEDKELETIAVDPVRFLTSLPAGFAHSAAAPRGRRETVLFALQRLARSDPQAAAQRLAGLEAAFPAEERAYAWGQIAWQAARRHQPEALAWYDKAQATSLSEEQLAWQARAALRAQDWGAVWRAIAAMPPAQAAQP
ncbi:MAG: lytic transglycosylase, partial [Betaproteobacteria bacterium HGW-Betaproteobacteria-11]